MLVFSRHQNQKIIIAAGTEYETTIEIVHVTGKKVRVGVRAPRNFTVHREEVQARIDAENRLKHETDNLLHA